MYLPEESMAVVVPRHWCALKLCHLFTRRRLCFEVCYRNYTARVAKSDHYAWVLQITSYRVQFLPYSSSANVCVSLSELRLGFQTGAVYCFLRGVENLYLHVPAEVLLLGLMGMIRDVGSVSGFVQYSNRAVMCCCFQCVCVCVRDQVCVVTESEYVIIQLTVQSFPRVKSSARLEEHGSYFASRSWKCVFWMHQDVFISLLVLRQIFSFHHIRHCIEIWIVADANAIFSSAKYIPKLNPKTTDLQ